MKSDITLLIDRSGSMAGNKATTIEAINKFINDQQKEGEDATLSVIQFDDQYEEMYVKPINEAMELNGSNYLPRGNTALLDAIGRTIANIRARQEANPTDVVIIAILTDGEENASKEFKQSAVKQLITDMQSLFSWKIIFLGANIDAIQEGAKLGIPSNYALTYTPTQGGIVSSTGSMSGLVGQLRGGGGSQGFSIEDRSGAYGGNIGQQGYQQGGSGNWGIGQQPQPTTEQGTLDFQKLMQQYQEALYKKGVK